MDNLHKRKVIIVNACPMCLSDEESVDYLLLNCVVAHKPWNMLLSSFQCSWVLPRTITDLYYAWKLPISSPKWKILWCLSFFATSRTLWKERNQRSFEGKPSLEDIFLRTRICITHWVSTLPDLWGLPLNFILFNWMEVALF